MEEKPRAVVGIIIFNNNGEILIMKSPKWNNKYIFPGGHVEFGEKLEETVIREAKEETGLDIYDLKFIDILEVINSPEFHKAEKHFVAPQFTAKTANTLVILNDEGIDYKWVKPEDALNENLISFNKEIIKNHILENAKL